MKSADKKLLFNKSDIAKMIGVTKGVLRFATEHAQCEVINWKVKYQLFNDSQVFEVIRAVKRRLTDQEIDDMIRNY